MRNCFILFFFLLGVTCPLLADAYPTKPLADMIREKSLSPPSPERLAKFQAQGKLSDANIREFLESFDPWANWTSKAEFTKQQRAAKENNGSIGMDVVRNKAGELVCVPYPNGAAHRAKVQEGDILVGIFSMEDVRQLSGPVGSTASFTVKRQFNSHSFTVRREKFTPPHVQLIQHDGFARIRIWRFNKKTPQLFADALLQAGLQPLVFDVRSNSGGNIVAALTCAAELLPQGTILGKAQLRTNARSRALVTKNRKAAKLGLYADIAPIFIWQDTLTASAAEAFVVALVDNGHAKSMGETSFGKGQVQSVFPFKGNQLILTTENLLSPQGLSWNDVGLRPQVVTRASLHNLIQETRKLLLPY